MRKKDRSSEEKLFDASLKTALRLLGTNPAEPDAPTPYPYVLYWDRFGRKGQRCKVIHRKSAKTAQITFEDGWSAIVDRQALRRI